MKDSPQTSSRPEIWLHHKISLLRNLEAYVFTAAMTTEMSENLAEAVALSIKHHGDHRVSGLKPVALNERYVQRALMVQGNLLTDPLRTNLKQSYYVHQTAPLALSVNDMDHMRLMAFGQGSFESAWHALDLLDDAFGAVLDYAFDEQMGYLTSKLENLGTGLLCEGILHLPVLHKTGYIQTLAESAGGIGIAIKPWMGPFYKLSNLVTLGRSELEIVLLMDQAAQMLVQREIAGRETLWASQHEQITDQLGRSFGQMAYCRMADVAEAVQWYSDLLLARDLGLLMAAETAPSENLHQGGVVGEDSTYERLCCLLDEGIDGRHGRNLRQSERQKLRGALLNEWAAALAWRR